MIGLKLWALFASAYAAGLVVGLTRGAGLVSLLAILFGGISGYFIGTVEKQWRRRP